MKLIVDASIVVKWLFAEAHSHEARQLLAPKIVLDAPDFILTEVANVIWKKARRKEIPSPHPYIEELANIADAVGLQPSTELVVRAATLAVQIDHPVYDCVYLACAEAAAAPLVTADARLAQRARACPTVKVWNVGEPEVVQRMAAAAAVPVIQSVKESN
ncbi:MAG: type II toxin-antitoxin system VapC family toxin [Gammaproteobacteria bacterium]|nr:type II toxin-antitoxin system VapC family toxin [Gammaproteobacteria bacterium]